MIVQVKFHDNDFFSEVEEACRNIMSEISNGYKGEEAFQLYIKERDRYGIENIRKAIVLSSYGYLIAKQASRVYDKIEYDFSKQDQYVQYLDKEISIKEIKKIIMEDENMETCYIDFFNQTVYIQ